MSIDDQLADIESLLDQTIDLAIAYAMVASKHYCSREYVMLGEPGFTPAERILHESLHGLERFISLFMTEGLTKTIDLIKDAQAGEVNLDDTAADISVGGLAASLRAIGLFEEETTFEEEVYHASAMAYGIVGPEAIDADTPGARDMFGFLSAIMRPKRPDRTDQIPSPNESPN
jgi:hypothetical protein